jgi:L-threonylcarbamoyladenylate synthase
VLDLTRGTPVVLRPGAVTIEMLREILPDVETLATLSGPHGPTPSPGMLERHYSPRAPLTLYQGADDGSLARLIHDATAAAAVGDTVGVLVASEDVPRLPATGTALHVVELGSLHDLAGVAARLYAGLRELDAAGVDVILARAFPADTGLGAAVQDRLRRAAAGRIVCA